MPIKLPPFTDTQCVSLTVCGEVRSEDPRILVSLKEQRTLIASYDAAGKKAHVRVHTGGVKGRHLHIDCVLSSYFAQSKQPAESNTLEDVLKFLSQFEGSEIDVGIAGSFELDLEALPERGIIRSLSREERTGDIAIRLTGGRLSVTGAPIDTLRWTLTDDERRILVCVHGNHSEHLDDGYLLRGLQWAEKHFELFVRGHTQNADV